MDKPNRSSKPVDINQIVGWMYAKLLALEDDVLYLEERLEEHLEG